MIYSSPGVRNALPWFNQYRQFGVHYGYYGQGIIRTKERGDVEYWDGSTKAYGWYQKQDGTPTDPLTDVWLPAPSRKPKPGAISNLLMVGPGTFFSLGLTRAEAAALMWQAKAFTFSVDLPAVTISQIQSNVDTGPISVTSSLIKRVDDLGGKTTVNERSVINADNYLRTSDADNGYDEQGNYDPDNDLFSGEDHVSGYWVTPPQGNDPGVYTPQLSASLNCRPALALYPVAFFDGKWWFYVDLFSNSLAFADRLSVTRQMWGRSGSAANAWNNGVYVRSDNGEWSCGISQQDPSDPAYQPNPQFKTETAYDISQEPNLTLKLGGHTIAAALRGLETKNTSTFIGPGSDPEPWFQPAQITLGWPKVTLEAADWFAWQ